MTKAELDPQLVTQLIADGVDLDKMIKFLNDLNSGKYDNTAGVEPESVPDLSNPAIVDRRCMASWSMPFAAARERFEALELPFSPESAGIIQGDSLLFDEASLKTIGIHLYPKAAYGVLNGGSASSYADVKKNKALNPAIFASCKERFDTLSRECRGKPKGITPAYINPDGSPGYSFLLLKLRMILEHKKLYTKVTGLAPCSILPAFQMTSFHTDEAIQKAFREYILMPELKGISDGIGCASIEMFTETQSMMAAITHSSEGKPRRIFDRANGKANTGLAMPGGHGQNFGILAPIYRKMYKKGIRYIWLGNIDNMGYTVDPVSLAIFALSGKEAAFEESYRTPMDVKGGILVCDKAGKLTCADIGPVISTKDMLAFEALGKPVLFNCGIGLFDLEKLIKRLPQIPFQLPLRITDQDKDAGLYAQAEQITWEIIGLLDDPLFFAVEKPRRFIAAKMLLETIMTSMPPEGPDSSGLKEVSLMLNAGLTSLFGPEYGLELRNGRWEMTNK